MGLTTVVDDGRAAIARRLPHIDYAAHAAYGGMFAPDPVLGRQAQARLQSLIDEVTRDEAARKAQFGYRYGVTDELTRELAQDGCAARQMEPRVLEVLKAGADPLIARIRERLDGLRARGEPISFKASQELVTPDRHGELWKLASWAMRESGVAQASTDYFRASDAKLRAAAVMVNQPGQSWCANIFRDAAVETPDTVGFHIDSSTLCTLKVVLYLNDVGSGQGPFGAIPTSHLWEQGSLERVRRRAFDKSTLVSRNGPQRRSFLSLPPELQVKAEFGGDMPSGDPETTRLLAEERVMTGPRGQMNLFDPEVVHRGGHASGAERQVMLLSVAARFYDAPRPAEVGA